MLASNHKVKVIDSKNSTHVQTESNSLEEAFEHDYVGEENYSQEDIKKINHDAEEAKKGINMSGPFYTTEELFAHLDSLKPE